MVDVVVVVKVAVLLLLLALSQQQTSGGDRMLLGVLGNIIHLCLLLLKLMLLERL